MKAEVAFPLLLAAARALESRAHRRLLTLARG